MRANYKIILSKQRNKLLEKKQNKCGINLVYVLRSHGNLDENSRKLIVALKFIHCPRDRKKFHWTVSNTKVHGNTFDLLFLRKFHASNPFKRWSLNNFQAF